MTYYVYCYYDKDSTPIYVGKGKGDRVKKHLTKSSNPELKSFIESGEEVSYKILDRFESANDALIFEFDLICLYGRKSIDSGGTLFNKSAGFEHFNLDPDWTEEEIRVYIRSLDLRKHFNEKNVDQSIIDEMVDLYVNHDNGLHDLRKRYGFGVGKIKRHLVESGVRIRTKSECNVGHKNNMYGRTGNVTPGFSGRKHTEESKKKISDTLKSKRN